MEEEYQKHDQLIISKRKRTKRQKSASSIDEQEAQDEDFVANCLILLAQGHDSSSSSPSLNCYQCKTCDRFFNSFQALGGHRASHKKPKYDDHDQHQDHHYTTLSLQISSSVPNSVSVSCNNSNIKSKVHECSICGAEFSSGQALGGHMRRHRSLTSTPIRPMNLVTSTTDDPMIPESRETKFRLCLDLNLPPSNPEEEHSIIQHEPKFAFTASCLVDCHY